LEPWCSLRGFVAEGLAVSAGAGSASGTALWASGAPAVSEGTGEFEDTELAGCVSGWERKSLGPTNRAAATRTTAATTRTLRHLADSAGILTVEGCGEVDGADCSRVAMSATVQRRCGSRRRQQWAIPMNGAGTVSGKGSAIPSQAGKRWVSASIRVIPSDQTSDAGKMFPLAISGASYALGGAMTPAPSPVRSRLSLASFNWSCAARTFDGLSPL